MKLKYIFIAIFLLVLSACGDDYLNTTYNSGISGETTENMKGDTPETLAEGYMNGIYGFMASWNSTGSGAHDDINYMGVMLATDLTAQDMTPTKLHWFNYDYMFDNRMATYRRTSSFWKTLYTMVNNANRVIDVFPGGPETVIAKGLVGQAYAVRALAYYYLIQLYQKSNTADASIASLPGVPMYYSAYEKKENKPGRNTVADVRSQINSDLTKAEELLANYSRPQKYFINLSVVKGIQARFYLLIGEWDKAQSAASAARQPFSIMRLVDDGFMTIDNSEWMWGFKHNAETQSGYASFFSHISSLAEGYAGVGYSPKAIDVALYQQIPATDNRKALFRDDTAAPPFPYSNVKFGTDERWTMDYVYMRASEMILIEAEALAQQGKTGDAALVLAKLMENRDPSWNKTDADVEDVYLQRRIELWGEGFGYFDLKRSNKGVVRSYAGSNHFTPINVPAGDVNWVYQIPLTEMQENKAIDSGEQND